MKTQDKAVTDAGKAPRVKFDPYQPATLIAEALAFCIYKQSGKCWIYNKFTFKAATCPEPSVWTPAQHIIQLHASKVS